MPAANFDTTIAEGFSSTAGQVFEVPDHDTINAVNAGAVEDAKERAQNSPEFKQEKVGDLDADGEFAVTGQLPYDSTINSEEDEKDEDRIIVTGADAANHLLSMRDDQDPALTFRSVVLATVLSVFQAVMTQIYSHLLRAAAEMALANPVQWKPTSVSIGGTFITLISFFLGQAWTKALPRGDLLELRWREKGNQGPLPVYIRIIRSLNPGPFGLKEHSIIVITALAASNASASSTVFAAQKLFYNIPLKASTVILSTVMIGLFGYGLSGIFRPITVWQVEAVYWFNIPTVKTLQGLHWQEFKESKPIRYFWYAYGSMSVYEFFPAYIWPWLNSVSVPCLAAMHATGAKAQTLTNIFGGSYNNEGLGLFNISFDWQYITTQNSSLPLKWQANAAAGYLVCYIAMLGVYYGNAWGAKDLPFMSTRLLTQDGKRYPTSKVFVDGILDQAALDQEGLPRLTATFAYALMIGNAAIGALVVHCFLFWGKDVVRAFRGAIKNKFDDRHHIYMTERYREVHWTWYAGTLIIAFIFGLIVVIKEDIGMPVWAYIVSLLLGIVIAPLSALLYSRYGNGVATNNLSKMVAGLCLPGRPVGNMYFSAFSHAVIANTLNLSQDLKMGEYLKIPPRIMFGTQIWGTILGGFINYVVMISIVTSNTELLLDGNGNNSWSGASIQSYNTNAASWALSRQLYTTSGTYYMVPAGLGIGGAVVLVHWLVCKVKPTVRGWRLDNINMPQFLLYSSFIPYNSSQTCVIWSQILAGFTLQYYIRNYHPRIFKNYSYLVTGAWDGAALTVMFILSFAVFGAGGTQRPFPIWWGNNQNGNLDLCPVADS